jgi:hypothetical protein
LQNFYKNDGVETDKMVEKSNLLFDKPEYKANTIKSLEKGNIVKVKFEQNDKVLEGKAILTPQNRNFKLYDQFPFYKKGRTSKKNHSFSDPTLLYRT